MKIVNSYGIEIKQMNKIFRPTVAIFNEAITFCVDVFEGDGGRCFALFRAGADGHKLLHYSFFPIFQI